METLLAVSLSAVLLVLIGSAINLYSRLVSDRRADVVNAQVARAVLHRMAEDLRAAFYAKQKGSGQGGEQAAPGDEAGGATGSASGNASAGGSASMGSSTATTDLTSGTVEVAPGLYGTEFELQVDVLGRFPKPVKYDTLAAAGLDPQAANLWSDPKIVTYYVRPMNPSELVGTPLQVFDSTSAGERNVLIRRVQSRARAIYAASGGGPNTMQEGEQLLCDQVAGLWFEYFDGLQWLNQWDSSVDGGLPAAVRITVTIVDDEEASAASPVGGIDSPQGDTYQITVSLPTAGATTDTSAL